MRCGLHYVRFCDLRTKQCAGAPGYQAATKAITDALAGGPFTRRKMHAFAKHPSGSRLGAPGARLPSDRLVLDPNAPKPPGPAIPQAQAGAPADLGGGPQEEDPHAGHPSASTPARAGQITPPEPEGPVGHDAAVPACSAQDEAHGGPKPEAGGSMPNCLQEQQGLGDARITDGGPQGIRVFLVLAPSRAQADGQPGAAMKAAKTGKPAKAKAKRAPNGPASQRARKSASLRAPSGNPKGHIQHWLARKVVGDATAPDGTRGSSDEPHGQAPESCLSESGCGTGMQPASWRSPGIPGSSTEPPSGSRRPSAGGLTSLAPRGQGASHGSPQGARRADPEGSRGSREHQADRRWSPPRGAGFGPEAGAISDGEGTPPRVRFIPDSSVPFPGEGGRQVLPRPGRKGTGQLEPD